MCALQLDLESNRVQSYDGAGNMLEMLNGLASPVLNDYPMSIFSYCSGHCFNLILQDNNNNNNNNNTAFRYALHNISPKAFTSTNIYTKTLNKLNKSLQIVFIK